MEESGMSLGNEEYGMMGLGEALVSLRRKLVLSRGLAGPSGKVLVSLSGMTCDSYIAALDVLLADAEEEELSGE